MFFAFTANLYPVLGVNPVIVQVNAPDDVHDPSAVPLVSVADDANADAVYSVMVSPPLEEGAAHVTAALVVVNVAATLVGEPGAATAGEVTVEESELNTP